MKTFNDWWASRNGYSVYEQYEDAKDAWDARQPEIDYWKSLEEKQRQKYKRCTENCITATKAFDELKKDNEKLRDLLNQVV